GIRQEFLPHVFEPFSQDNTASTTSQTGLGIGLTVAHHIIELHGGRLGVESPGEGQGAIFTVTLPVLATDNEGITRPLGQSKTQSLA
ncbi:MAG TPA: ATP-binding protein, partial [Candidatus Caenarcaniphilales bacterium]